MAIPLSYRKICKSDLEVVCALMKPKIDGINVLLFIMHVQMAIFQLFNILLKKVLRLKKKISLEKLLFILHAGEVIFQLFNISLKKVLILKQTVNMGLLFIQHQKMTTPMLLITQFQKELNRSINVLLDESENSSNRENTSHRRANNKTTCAWKWFKNSSIQGKK